MAAQTLRVLARLIGDARRPRARRGARQGRARAARRRGRAPRPLAARPLLRHGRRHAAVPVPAVRPRRLDRRPLAVPRAARRTSRRCSAGSTARATATATGCSSTAGVPSRVCATRAGRTPTRACSTSTGRRSSRRWRWSSRRRTRYRAKRRLARLFALDGDAARADALLRRGGRRCATGSSASGCPSAASTRWGSAPTARPSAALASNQGHLLWALRAARRTAREAVRDALMSDAMFSGWGIRTLGEGEAGYNPVGYHLGTVWPHDTAMIAFGLRKYGFDDGLRADLRGAARGGGERGGLPAARAVRRLLAHRVRDAGAVSRRLPAAGLGGGRDPVPGHRRARARARRARAAAARPAPVASALALPRRGPRPADRRRDGRPPVRARRRRAGRSR